MPRTCGATTTPRGLPSTRTSNGTRGIIRTVASTEATPGCDSSSATGTARADASVHRGHAELRTWVEGVLETAEDFRVDPQRFIDAGQFMLVPVRISGT